MKIITIITVTIITLLSLAMVTKYVANGVTTCWVADDRAAELMETRPLAEAGDPDAQSYMGFMYDSGWGVCEDKNEADKWYKLAVIGFTAAAEQGSAHAQTELDYLFTYGRGVPYDSKEGARWLKKAAAQGDPHAIQNLYYKYTVGQGVPQDFVKANMWHLIAVANGYHERDNDYFDFLTETELSKSQSMADECMRSNYKNCWYKDVYKPVDINLIDLEQMGG